MSLRSSIGTRIVPAAPLSVAAPWTNPGHRAAIYFGLKEPSPEERDAEGSLSLAWFLNLVFVLAVAQVLASVLGVRDRFLPNLGVVVAVALGWGLVIRAVGAWRRRVNQAHDHDGPDRATPRDPL